MKHLNFNYQMKLTFDNPVRQHHFTLKCVPVSSNRQQIQDLNTDVYPKEFLSEDEDSFGNFCIYGYCKEPHAHFSLLVTGTAFTGLADYEPAKADYQIGLFKYQTPYTRPGVRIHTFHDQFTFERSASSLDKSLTFMAELCNQFQYMPGSTSLYTTAEEAMVLGKGVCQDYSHILLSLCRLEKIPCRYVVGMLLGEGLSHAWVEIWDHGRWIALDPTNNLIVDDQHIKISSGRDYNDCLINQGLFTGFTGQRQNIHVSVTEIPMKHGNGT